MSLIGIGKLEQSRSEAKGLFSPSKGSIVKTPNISVTEKISLSERKGATLAPNSTIASNASERGRLQTSRNQAGVEGATLAPILEGQLSVDVYQTDEEIILISPIAGTTSDQISISVTEDILSIKGRREMNLKEKIHKENFYIQECFWGNFSRSVVLPAAVDTNRVEAHFKNNVLTIRIPKTELVKTRMIRIKEE